jgi:hypothetical protein
MTHAHTHGLAHGSLALWIGLGLLLVAGLLLADRRRAWHRLVLALALLVAVFAFESAVHSVHHLLDPQAADSCTFLAGSKHTDTASPSVPDAGAPLWTAASAAVIDADLAPPLCGFRTHEGRAPPALPAI